MLIILIIASVIFFSAFMCFYIRSAQPASFDQIEESLRNQETEYIDDTQVISIKGKERKIREVI